MSAPIPFGWSVRSRRPIDERFITATTTTRNDLNTFRRHEGLETYVEADDTTYKLVGGIDNTNWVEVLKNINLLTEETTIDTATDTIAFWDASAGRHRKVKFEDLPIDGSKWSDVTGGYIRRNSRVGIGVDPTDMLHVGGNAFNVGGNALRLGNLRIVDVDSIAFGTQISGLHNDRLIISGTTTIGFEAGNFYLGSPTDFNFNRESLTQHTIGTYRNLRIIVREFGTIEAISFGQNSAGTLAYIKTSNLPTSDPLIAGVWWSNGGVITISAG
jgi:hypothetical protein